MLRLGIGQLESEGLRLHGATCRYPRHCAEATTGIGSDEGGIEMFWLENKMDYDISKALQVENLGPRT